MNVSRKIHPFAVTLVCSLALSLVQAGCVVEANPDENVGQAQQATGSLFTSATGIPAGYVRTDGVTSLPHVFGHNGSVMELKLTNGTWTWDNLSQDAGAPKGSGSVVSAYVRSDAHNSVVYWAADGDLHELYLNNGSTQWSTGDLSQASNTPAPNAASLPVGFVDGNGVNSVVYCDQDNGHVIELFLSSHWQSRDLTVVSGSPVLCNNDDVIPYVRSDGVTAVLFGSLMNGSVDIWELSELPGSQAWGAADLNSASGTTAHVGLVAWGNAHVRPDGTDSVVFVGDDNHIHEMYLSPGMKWQPRDLTMASGDMNVPATRPWGFNRSDGVVSYVFVDVNGLMQEITLTNNTTWGSDGMINIPGPVAPSLTNFLTAYQRHDGVNEVGWFDGGFIHVTDLEGTKWVDTNLSKFVQEPLNE